MLGDGNSSALILMDNFKGQITIKIQTLLEENNAYFPPNSIDLLQPLDVFVNKPV